MENCYIVTYIAEYVHTKGNEWPHHFREESILCVTKSFKSAMEFAKKQIPAGEDRTLHQDTYDGGVLSSFPWKCEYPEDGVMIFKQMVVSEHALID